MVDEGSNKDTLDLLSDFGFSVAGRFPIAAPTSRLQLLPSPLTNANWRDPNLYYLLDERWEIVVDADGIIEQIGSEVDFIFGRQQMIGLGDSSPELSVLGAERVEFAITGGHDSYRYEPPSLATDSLYVIVTFFEGRVESVSVALDS